MTFRFGVRPPRGKKSTLSRVLCWIVHHSKCNLTESDASFDFKIWIQSEVIAIKRFEKCQNVAQMKWQSPGGGRGWQGGVVLFIGHLVYFMFCWTYVSTQYIHRFYWVSTVIIFTLKYNYIISPAKPVMYSSLYQIGYVWFFFQWLIFSWEKIEISSNLK